MLRARSQAEFIALVQEALDEVDDLRQSIEYDSESMSHALGFIDILDQHLKTLQQALADGKHEFADVDLPFMDLIRQQRDEILPFKQLLKRINLTHREGLEDGAA